MSVHVREGLVNRLCYLRVIFVIVKDGSSALMEAARLGKTEAVSLLLKAGAALDLQNMVNTLAFTHALSVEFNAPQQGDSAVILATANYHLPVLKELVRAGADLNLQNEVTLKTAHNSHITYARGRRVLTLLT